MRVVDVSEEHRGLFALCLEDWSAEALEAGPARGCWIERFERRGLRAKLALDDSGEVAGMIQYLPIEESWADGTGLYLILCIWVHGYDEGRGDFQGRGMGTALLEAAEADARALGATGIAAWGIAVPFWMPAAWFEKHGYQSADRQGVSVLLWKPFTAEAAPPRWHPDSARLPDPVQGKVNVTAFTNGWCMSANVTTERIRRVAAEFGDQVVYREIDTSKPGAVAACGCIDGVFINGEQIRTAPPPDLTTLRSEIEARLTRL